MKKFRMKKKKLSRRKGPRESEREMEWEKKFGENQKRNSSTHSRVKEKPERETERNYFRWKFYQISTSFLFFSFLFLFPTKKILWILFRPLWISGKKSILEKAFSLSLSLSLSPFVWSSTILISFHADGIDFCFIFLFNVLPPRRFPNFVPHFTRLWSYSTHRRNKLSVVKNKKQDVEKSNAENGGKEKNGFLR